MLRLDHHDGSLRVGMETSAVAHALWHHDAVAVDRVLLEVHEHAGRLRDNLDEIGRAGDRLVDAVFDSRVLPPEAFRWREPFRARLLRDHSRSYHRAGRHAEARLHFERAWRADPAGTFRDLRNMRRYAVSRARVRVADPALPQPRPSREPGVVEVDGASFLSGHRMQMQADPLGFVGRCTRLGSVVKLALDRPTYLLGEPADIQHICSAAEPAYARTGLQTAFTGVFGRGLFTRTGRPHIDFRRTVQPFLHRGRLDAFVDPIRRSVAETLPAWHIGPVVDVSQGMQELTLRAAARTILGSDDVVEAAAIFEDIQACHQKVVRNRAAVVALADWMPTRRKRVLVAHVQRMHATVARLIERHRQGRPDDSVLSRLVHLRNPEGRGYRDDEIRDHLLLMFLAAREPTATALAWTLDLLARHPHEQQFVREEIEGIASADATNVGDAAAILQRPRTTAVVLESLRLHPPIWLVARRATCADRLPSGVVIPRGATVAVSIHHVHRDGRWYEEPETFRPARFLQGVADRRAAGTHLPFGLGPAARLGEDLVRLMLALTLESALRHYEFEPTTGEAPRPTSVNGFTSRPDRPVRLVVRRRG